MAGKYIALPKGVSEKTFDAAINAFRGVLGETSVLTSAEQLAPYIKTMMPVPDSEHAPSAALMATTVEQIQKIVGICNQYKVPVWTYFNRKKSGLWLRGAGRTRPGRTRPQAHEPHSRSR